MPRFAAMAVLASLVGSRGRHPASLVGSRGLWRACTLGLWLLCASCNTTPTLPLPPPIASATAPDSQGFALVSGQANSLAYVSVLNERTDEGVITRAAEDGRFEARIQAQVGDLLTIWQEVANEVGELKQTVVPPPR